MIKQGDKTLGIRVKTKVVKNKVAPPFRAATFDIMFNEGISKEGDVIELGVEMGIIKKAGAFFSYGDTRLGQGKEAAKKFLKDNPEVFEEINKKIREAASSHNVISFNDGSDDMSIDED